MRTKLGVILVSGLLAAALALFMTLLDGTSGATSWRSWPGYMLLITLVFLSLWSAARLFSASVQAARLAWAASGLRLIVGVGLMLALPVFGYIQSEVTQAGYFYYDTSIRDQMAWQVASEDLPILDAFKGLYPGDQYGGMLALSAVIYRFLSPDVHRPFLILILTAGAAGWGVLAVWATARLFSKKDVQSNRLSMLAAAIFAFFPEAVILGATHMREAFVIPALALALCGLAEMTMPASIEAGPRTGIDSGRNLNSKVTPRSLLLVLVGLGVSLFFQPSLALAGVIAIGGLYLVLDFSHRKRLDWRMILLIAVIGVVLIGVITASWGRMTFSDSKNPLDILGDWLLFNLKREGGAVDSEQIQAVLGKLPLAARSLVLSVFGLLQPFLPAAAFSTGNAFWRLIGGVRALGWYLMLPLLGYALWAVFRSGKDGGVVQWRWLTLWVWAWSWFAALRAGGDMWDNPRYRAVFLGMQALLAAWVLVRHSRADGLRRLILVEASMVIVFCAWYIGRYILPWLHFDFVVAIIGSVILSIAALATDWVISKPDQESHGA